jgi:predicted DNA-binding transcriptional regulator YafY
MLDVADMGVSCSFSGVCAAILALWHFYRLTRNRRSKLWRDKPGETGNNSPMNQLDRLYQLERLLRSRQALGRDALIHELEISRATLKRYLEVLRDRMNVPVVYDRDSNTYTISQPADKGQTGTQRQELPGVWFSQQEIIALLTMYQLIAGLDSAGMLQRHLQPILQRLTAMLDSTHMQAQELQRRVRIIGAARREVPSQFFERVGLALTQRRKLQITYFTRSRNETSERTCRRSGWCITAIPGIWMPGATPAIN